MSLPGFRIKFLPIVNVANFHGGTFLLYIVLHFQKPFNFLPNYKNPCWKTNKRTIPISCLPYFYLVGAPKAGTTDVFVRLNAHPEFARPSSKEPHWLTRARFRKYCSSAHIGEAILYQH